MCYHGQTWLQPHHPDVFEAVVRRPRVRDFESLTEDIVSLKGFWRNGITRILLVVALANLGSTIGTLVGLPLMTRLLG